MLVILFRAAMTLIDVIDAVYEFSKTPLGKMICADIVALLPELRTALIKVLATKHESNPHSENAKVIAANSAETPVDNKSS